MSDTVPITRISLSLPCHVPVVPGTPDTSAPIEERTERCAVDAWWMVGIALICTHHLREFLGDEYDAVCGDQTLNPREVLPWAEMHRYDQESAGIGAPPLGGNRAP